jgi:FKBP-type peptidyl-prolyl cis-trans isomerase SlyD
MKIDKNKFVSLIYKLRLNSADGEMVEETTKERPLEFVYGMGRMIEMFEKKLKDLEAGSDFNFEIKAKDAYGEFNKEYIVELPKELFKVNGKVDEELITPGNHVPMQDNNGNRMDGIVLEIIEDRVKMDFNHPLAGENLFFSGTVLEVRDATEEDLQPPCASECGSGCDGCH